MAGVCLLVVLTGLLLKECGLAAGVTEANTGAVFVSQQDAHMVLLRQRRYNSGHLEEFQKDNLERECKEEVCTMEEAREVFENDEKTMEFWAGYIDGDQCKPPPCQNDGVCEDGVGTYVCWCKPNFSGKNCEIEVTKQCSVNNGGCSHFCMMRAQLPVCQCAAGYKLGPDKRSCLPTETFSCGQVILESISKSTTRILMTPRTFNETRANISSNASDVLQDVFYDDDNITHLYDYDLALNDSELTDVPAASAIDIRSFQSELSLSLDPTDDYNISEWSGNTGLNSWAFYPTLPPITADENVGQRIVGGDEAIPGEIPWQVTLMSDSPTLGRAQSFCGGSLLSESWVITAAHCLVLGEVPVRGFFVRVGEHDLEEGEGSEQDRLAAEQHLHPMYNHKKSPYNHDIALLKLNSPVELSNRRRPICLGHKSFTESILRESRGSLVSGWGRQKFLGIEATKLQKLEVPYVERTLCKQSSREHITRFMFCAGYGNEKKDSCQGDSGGPHATNFKGTWFLTGIVSWGEECAKDGKYGIYTRVSQYYPWISQTTGIRINN